MSTYNGLMYDAQQSHMKPPQALMWSNVDISRSSCRVHPGSSLTTHFKIGSSPRNQKRFGSSARLAESEDSTVRYWVMAILGAGRYYTRLYYYLYYYLYYTILYYTILYNETTAPVQDTRSI